MVSVTATSCTVSGPTNGVEIRVLMGTGTVVPVAGAQITGNARGYCNGSPQISALQPVTTNSSGWANLLDGGFGIYDLNITRAYTETGPILIRSNTTSTEGPYTYTDVYHLSLPTSPLATTLVTYNISSGNVTTIFCYYGRCLSGSG